MKTVDMEENTATKCLNMDTFQRILPHDHDNRSIIVILVHSDDLVTVA